MQVVQGAAVATFVLNGIALWKQETRRPLRGAVAPAADPSFAESWATFCRGDQTIRRLIIVGIGTMAFAMADILLEPYGGQVLDFSVSATTKLTALLAAGGLLGFGFASYALGKGADAYRMAQKGAIIGVPAFILVMLSAPLAMPALFLVGNFLIGFGAALFGHGTLTATMSRAPKDQAGLALGAWGAVQATAAGVAMALSGTIRDLVNLTADATGGLWGLPGFANGYMTVYALEIMLLLIAIVASIPLLRRATAEGGSWRGSHDITSATAPATQPRGGGAS